MKKIVIAERHFSFALTEEQIRLYAKLANLKLYEREEEGDSMFYLDRHFENYFDGDEIVRDDPHLVRAVSEVISTTNKVVEIPEDADWEIVEICAPNHDFDREIVIDRRHSWR